MDVEDGGDTAWRQDGRDEIEAVAVGIVVTWKITTCQHPFLNDEIANNEVFKDSPPTGPTRSERAVAVD